MAPYERPEDEKVRSAKWYLPLAALAAVAIAYLVGTYVINNRDPSMAANPANQTSATGGSSGESGQSTIQKNPDAQSNPGAAPAPTKAPEIAPGPAEQPAQPKP